MLLFVLAVIGCSSKSGPRYPEDHARFQRIVGAVESLTKAYIDKDENSLHELLLPLETLRKWEQEINKDFRTFSDISLDVSIERMMIKGDRIKVFVHWEGVWKQSKEDLVGVSERGHGVLLWSGSHVILLAGVDGSLPFGMATRQALSS